MCKNKQVLLICLFLSVTPFIAFQQVNRCDFVNYDDPTYVTENVHIRNGITTEAVRWALTTGYAANWHPLTWMSHMLDVQLFGLKPDRHHLVNLLFHIANTLLLFFVFNRMTEAPWKSAFTAALFALHPLHVQSVAWVAERKDVLSTFFWMLTMASYVSYVGHSPSPGHSPGGRGGSRFASYLAVIIFFALGLMAKPMVVTLPFVLLLLDYWPLKRMSGIGCRVSDGGYRALHSPGAAQNGSIPAKTKKGESREKLTGQSGSPPRVTGPRFSVFLPLLLEKVPLFLLAALSSIVTYAIQQKGGAVKSIEAFPLWVRIANAFVSYAVYIEKALWPKDLAVFYPYPGGWSFRQVAGAILLFGVITVTVIRLAKRFPCLTVGWLWFAGTLVPVIGIVQVGRQAMADRYTYIPLIGLFIMAAWGVPELLGKRRYWKEALSATSLFILACFSFSTWKEAGYWKDSITLYDRALEATGPNDTVYNSRGDAWCRRGNLEQAIADFDRAVGINHENAEAYYNRGVTFGKLGNHRRAIEDFDRAIEINPGLTEPYYNRGFAYGELRDYGKAIENYDLAIRINPENAVAYNSRGVANDKLGNYRKAISDYDRAIEIDPGYAMAFNNRGFAYGRLGNFRQAIEDYSRAIDLDPDYVKPYYNRAVAYGELGNGDKAMDDLKTAARFGHEGARNYLRNMGVSWKGD